MLATFALELVATTAIVLSQRRNQERAEVQLHVQSWQLEQLISD